MEERRRRTRVSFSGEVELVTPDGMSRSLRLRDISLGGLYALGEDAVRAGTPCEVRIKLGAGDIRLQGRVVRTDRDGVGVAFEEMAPEDFMVLKRLVELNAPEPDRVHLELSEVVR